MSDSMFYVSQASVRNLKQIAQRKVLGVSSAHLSESIAAALGFKTYAALRAAVAIGQGTAAAQKPSNAKLAQRLRELGYPAPDDLALVPEFQHSYTPIRTLPLRTKRGVRWHGWRNVMVSAINAGLSQRLFGLSPGENWWPGSSPESQACATGTYRFQIDGNLPAMASVDAISGDELSIAVVVNPRDPEAVPIWYRDLSSGDATAHAWLERRLGAWIQDGGECFHCRKSLQPRLAGLAIEPLGYADFGSFIM